MTSGPEDPTDASAEANSEANSEANPEANPGADPGAKPEATITRRVDWVDTDASGHWHNGTILRFLEAAEDALHEELGMPELFGRVPRVSLHIDFVSRLWFRDEPTTRIWVDSVGSSSMTYGFEVTLGDRVVARGTSVVVQADPDGEGSKPWTEEQRARLTGRPLTGA